MRALALAAILAAVLCVPAAGQAPVRPGADTRQWSALAKDGLHDPRSPAVGQLQEPRDALSVLPPDIVGNQVRWVEALAGGSINPRSSIRPETDVRVLESVIVMSRYASLKAVRFPHREHTLWLDCSNCHEKIFVSKAGANRITMMRILQGELCGQCHGAVAFPLTECGRCHSVAVGDLPPGPGR
jgi:c(7)-type cytochrome triheme protein